MSAALTAAPRRAHNCPDCGQVLGELQEDLSMVCAAVVVDWRGGSPTLRPGCGLRMYLCRAHGLRTRRKGDTDCRCAVFAQPVGLQKAA